MNESAWKSSAPADEAGSAAGMGLGTTEPEYTPILALPPMSKPTFLPRPLGLAIANVALAVLRDAERRYRRELGQRGAAW